MHRFLWLGLLVAALVVLALGCPRKQAPPPNTIPPANTSQGQAATPPGTTTPPGATTPGTTPPPTGETPPPTGEAAPPVTGETTPPTTTPPTTTPPTPDVKPPAGVTTVVLETTKGNIVLEVHPDWSPLGVAHFLELVNKKFYDGAPWFRVMEGFVAQCGVAADPKMNEEWMEKTIQDEPVIQGNQEGYVAFGKSGAPNSRSTHIFINMADNTGSLDPQGFSCFAKVTEGMDVVAKLERVVFEDQPALARAGGMEAFKKMFPKGDYIKKAYVKK
jgi:peptidyl-prolyl cis-trans isomerase A (cyclophilin A)